MIRLFSTLILLVFALSFADVKPSASVAVQFTKKSANASKGNLDGAFVRAEGKLAGSAEKSDVSGLVHLRFQVNYGTGSVVNAQLRQAFVKWGSATGLGVKFGRWYDSYAVGGYYFGRYAYGVSGVGSGSMNTNYSIIDAAQLSYTVKNINTTFRFAFIPKDVHFEDDYLLIGVGGSPVKPLKFNILGNIEVQRADKAEPENRLAVNLAGTFIEATKTGAYIEYGNVDLMNAADNNWFNFGLTTAAGKVLDRIQAEFEVKKDRGNDYEDANFAWMLLFRKKANIVTFDLNVGSDPKSLGSKNPGEIGVILRTTGSF